MRNCRSCDSRNCELVIDLGEQSPPNALANFRQPQRTWPLRMVVCKDCWLMQTEVDVPHDEIFDKDYPYFSGQSQDWVDHCKAYAAQMTQRFGAPEYVIEIGGNDGTLLKNFSCGRLNVEPCENVARAAVEAGVPTTAAIWQNLTRRPWVKADLIVANNVMAHTPDLTGFVERIEDWLAPSGVATIEFPWVLNMIRETQFDTIYHEHYSYLSLTALEPLFQRRGLRVFDVESIPTHGGSLRVFVKRISYSGNNLQSESLAAYHEAEAPLRDMSTYIGFRERTAKIKSDIWSFLKEVGPVHGYGAAAKGSVFLNYCGLTEAEIPFIADTTPAKQGKLMPNTHIPIVPEKPLIEAQPEWVLILPWNWKSEIIRKLRPALPRTKFVTAIPELVVSEPLSL